MKRGRQGEGGGRPKKPIDYAAAEKLAGLQCTQEEIAAYMGLSVDTLMRDPKFCGIYKDGIQKGRMSLRRHQWKALEAGNSTMLVWLGKQYLGQRDRIANEITGREGGPIEVLPVKQLEPEDRAKLRAFLERQVTDVEDMNEEAEDGESAEVEE